MACGNCPTIHTDLHIACQARSHYGLVNTEPWPLNSCDLHYESDESRFIHYRSGRCESSNAKGPSCHTDKLHIPHRTQFRFFDSRVECEWTRPFRVRADDERYSLLRVYYSAVVGLFRNGYIRWRVSDRVANLSKLKRVRFKQRCQTIGGRKA